jgi:hypothetical protein
LCLSASGLVRDWPARRSLYPEGLGFASRILEGHGYAVLQYADHRRFFQAVSAPAREEGVRSAQPLNEALFARTQDLLRQAPKVPKYPDQMQPIPKTRPQIARPEWGKNAEHAFGQFLSQHDLKPPEMIAQSRCRMGRPLLLH